MCPYCGSDCPRLGTTCRVRGFSVRDESYVMDAAGLSDWAHRLLTDLIDRDEIVRQLIDADLWDQAEDPKVIQGVVIESWTDRDRPVKGEIES
jgi:hypothetical protein